MTDDPFFNRITQQLIETPATSRQALEAAARGSMPPVPPGAAFELESARSWVKYILKDAYHPPDDVPFLAFPMENDLCDTIRARYKVDDYRIEVAQSRHLITLRIKGLHFPPGTSDKRKAEEAARKLFVMGARAGFLDSGAFRNGTYGKQDVQARGRVDADWPHWFDNLRWWYDSDEIGFITLKASGGPTMEPISAQEDRNIHWFK